MPRHNFLKPLAIITCGALLGASITHLTVQHLKPEPKNRFIASQPMAKIGLEQNARQVLDIKIDTSELAAQDAQVSILKVKITALRPLEAGLIYNWNVSDDIQVLEGSLHDQLGAFTNGETKEFTVRLRGFSKEIKRYVSFEVQGATHQRPLRREVLISSRVEDSFEYVIQQNQKKNVKAGHNKVGAQSNSRFSPENVIH